MPQKNHERLLEAVALLEPPPAGLRVWVIGDGPLRSRLEARAAALGIADRVRFGGLRRDAPDILAHADLAVFSSDWEGLSVAALEAPAPVRPCVHARLGHGRAAREGAGAIVPATPAALADAMGRLLADPERRAEMGRAGRRRSEQHGVAAMVTAYERLYVAAAHSR